MLFIFFPPGYPRLASFFGEAGYRYTLGNKGGARVLRSRHRLWDLEREEREAQPGTVSTFHQRTLRRQAELSASPALPVVPPFQILYWPLQVPLQPGPSTHLGGLPKLLTSVHKVGQGC